MPVIIPGDLPAAQVLESENIFVMNESRALSQDIRPLKILILNLMPTKIATETQLARLLGNTPLQIELTFMSVSRVPKNTPIEHMNAFYIYFKDVKHENFDGMIITGAPVEFLNYEDVDYWPELCEIMDWTKTHVHSTFHLCWGAFAGLYYHYGIQKYAASEKLFGVFKHKVTHKGSILFRGSDDIFMVPHSRYIYFKREDILKVKELKILAESDEAGVYAISTDGGSQVFITGHSEYDPETLANEYWRDKNAGLNIKIPVNYYPNDDDTQPPLCTWRSCAHMLFSNWLNYFVYQSTPYDLGKLNN